LNAIERIKEIEEKWGIHLEHRLGKGHSQEEMIRFCLEHLQRTQFLLKAFKVMRQVAITQVFAFNPHARPHILGQTTEAQKIVDEMFEKKMK